MEVGKRIAAIRKEKGMSQEQFGQLFHVTRQTVSNWENEKSFPDLQTLVKISDTFEVSMDELLKENASMVRKIDWERKVGELFKKLFIATGVVLLLAVLFVPILVPAVTPEDKRNVSEFSYTAEGHPEMYAYLNFPDATPSRAIVRTYTKKDYDNFSEKQLQRIYKEIAGKVEGDAPMLKLEEDGQKLWVVVQDYAHKNIVLDEPPTYRLTIYSEDAAMAPNVLNENYEGQILQQEGVMTEEDYGYSWQIDNPFIPGEAYANLDYEGRYWKQCRLEVTYYDNMREFISVTSFAIKYEPEG